MVLYLNFVEYERAVERVLRAGLYLLVLALQLLVFAVAGLRLADVLLNAELRQEHVYEHELQVLSSGAPQVPNRNEAQILPVGAVEHVVQTSVDPRAQGLLLLWGQQVALGTNQEERRLP